MGLILKLIRCSFVFLTFLIHFFLRRDWFQQLMQASNQDLAQWEALKCLLNWHSFGHFNVCYECRTSQITFPALTASDAVIALKKEYFIKKKYNKILLASCLKVFLFVDKRHGEILCWRRRPAGPAQTFAAGFHEGAPALSSTIIYSGVSSAQEQDGWNWWIGWQTGWNEPIVPAATIH